MREGLTAAAGRERRGRKTVCLSDNAVGVRASVKVEYRVCLLRGRLLPV